MFHQELRIQSGKIKDWYELSTATLDVEYNVNSHSSLNFAGGVNFGTVAVPDLSSSLAKVTDNHFASHNFRLLVGYQTNLSEGSDFSFHVSSVQWEDFGGFYQSRFKRYDFETNYSHTFGSKNMLITGITGEYLKAQAAAMDKERLDNLIGCFVQDEYKVNRYLKITAGLRLDKHTSLDIQYSPRITANITPAKNHLFRIGFGQAFKKPTFLENYFYQANGSYSIVLGMLNETGTSKPERISSVNIDYQNIVGPVSTRISLFKDFVYDLIDTKKVQPYKTYTYAVIYENSGDINISGGELEIKAKPFQFIQLFANTSYQKIDYKTEINGQKLSVPEIKGNVGVQLNLKRGMFAETVMRYTGRKEAQYSYIYQVPNSIPPKDEYYFMKIQAVSIFDINLGYRYRLSWGNIEPSIKCFNIFNTRNIQYPIFDSAKAYFGLDTPARNYTNEMKAEFENRNALNDRKILFSLKINFF